MYIPYSLIFVVERAYPHITIAWTNISRDNIFAGRPLPAKTAKIFDLENFRLYGIYISALTAAYTPVLD